MCNFLEKISTKSYYSSFIQETIQTDIILCQQNLLKINPFSHITEPIEFVNRFSFK